MVTRDTAATSSNKTLGTLQDTTLSKALFVRLTQSYEPVLLRTQYRCHPQLSAVPNSLFYGSQLIDGVTKQQRQGLLSHLPPLVFVDMRNGREQTGKGGSLYNEAEVRAVSCVLGSLLAKGVEASSIGVISLYKAQVRRLQEATAAIHEKQDAVSRAPQGDTDAHSDDEAAASPLDPDVDTTETGSSPSGDSVAVGLDAESRVQVNTVDAFQVCRWYLLLLLSCLARGVFYGILGVQGGEKDVIILSCCRTAGIGFLCSPHRTNVAITRARRHLVIV